MMKVQIKKVIVGVGEFEGIVMDDEFSTMLAYASSAEDVEVGGLFQLDSDGLAHVELMFITAGTKTYKAELTDFDIEQIEKDLTRRLT